MSQIALEELALACQTYRRGLEKALSEVSQLERQKTSLERLVVEGDKALEKANERIAVLAPRIGQLEDESRINAKYRATMTEEISKLKARKRKAKRRG